MLFNQNQTQKEQEISSPAPDKIKTGAVGGVAALLLAGLPAWGIMSAGTNDPRKLGITHAGAFVSQDVAQGGRDVKLKAAGKPAVYVGLGR